MVVLVAPFYTTQKICNENYLGRSSNVCCLIFADISQVAYPCIPI
jgi:hypothetical protein